ncbi:hypothetical protein DRE_03916 [Drechslerella stenobrocha 248]|uniref:Uncharacterized protein n=1 Tax=Drechslerella stenobrocha 248 TaxID=1043628 RepID=W7HTX2_9PEZI|nr:hypothetical protein DRE_03916 [Drechslerella stenobrocha 248]
MNESNKEQLSELQEGHVQVKSEFVDLLDEREKFKSKIHERDLELDKIKGHMEEYHKALQTQRDKYRGLLDACAKADETNVTNRALQANLNRAQDELEKERNIVVALQARLQEMNDEIEKIKNSMSTHHSDITQQITVTMKTFEQLASSQEENFAKSRDLLLKLQYNSEEPDSELFKFLSTISTAADSQWTGLQETLSKLCRDQEQASHDYAERFEKWKTVKEILTMKIESQATELNRQTATINLLNEEKGNLNSELQKQKELNRCLVEAKTEEKELLQTRMTEVTSKFTTSENARRELLVRNSLLESSVQSLELRLEAERDKSDSEKKILVETNMKDREEIESLRIEQTRASNDLIEIEQIRQQVKEASLSDAELRKAIAKETEKAIKAAKLNEDLNQILETKDEQLKLAASRWADASVKQDRTDAELTALKAELQLKSEEIQSQFAKSGTQSTRVSLLENELEDKTRTIGRLGEDLRISNSNLKSLEDRFGVQKSTLEYSKQLRENLQKPLQEHHERVASLEEALGGSSRQATALQKASEAKDHKITDLERQLGLANKTIEEQSLEINIKRNELQATGVTGSQEIPESTQGEPKPTIRQSKRNPYGKIAPATEDVVAGTFPARDSAIRAADENEIANYLSLGPTIDVRSTESQESSVKPKTVPVTRPESDRYETALEGQEESSVLEGLDFEDLDLEGLDLEALDLEVVPATQDREILNTSLPIAPIATQTDFSANQASLTTLPVTPDDEVPSTNPKKRSRVADRKARLTDQASAQTDIGAGGKVKKATTNFEH